jgi:uncharacterized membrane protein
LCNPQSLTIRPMGTRIVQKVHTQWWRHVRTTMRGEDDMATWNQETYDAEQVGRQRSVNVGDAERAVSTVGGAALALYGLSRFSFGGLVLAAVGGMLGYRGLSGHCDVYQALGIDRGSERMGVVEGNLGVKIDKSVTVNAPPDRVYRFWRNFENLPQIMSHLDRVKVLSQTHSRWVVKAPVGMKVEWEAEIINDKPNEIIAWRSTGNALVDHAGSVNFERTPDGHALVKVSLQYDPPGGEWGHAVASLFNEDAGTQIQHDLDNFKRAVEEGRLAAA